MSNNAVAKDKRDLFYYVRLWGIITVLLVGLGLGGIHVYEEQQAQLKLFQQQLYGEWVEQDVADYAAESFVVEGDGVHVNRRLASTRYEFDGKELKFMVGNEEHVFRVIDAKMTKLRRIAPAHYESTFIKVKQP